MKTTYKILAIMGQSGAGKDSFADSIIKNNYIPNTKRIILCTSRPIRENEQDGVNYHFMDKSDFVGQILDKEMLEFAVFNDWYYGTSIYNLDATHLNIGVYNPEAVESLQRLNNVDIEIVYIIADNKVRLLRQLNREEHPNCDEIVRRYGTDKQDFNEERIEKINPDYKILNNGEQSIDELAKNFSQAYMLGKDK